MAFDIVPISWILVNGWTIQYFHSVSSQGPPANKYRLATYVCSDQTLVNIPCRFLGLIVEDAAATRINGWRLFELCEVHKSLIPADESNGLPSVIHVCIETYGLCRCSGLMGFRSDMKKINYSSFRVFSLLSFFFVMGLLAARLRSLNISIFRLESLCSYLANKDLFDKSPPPVFLGQSCTENFSWSLDGGGDLGELKDLSLSECRFGSNTDRIRSNCKSRLSSGVNLVRGILYQSWPN